MTLKEKFKKIDINLSETHSTLITNREADIMEQIADEFAIEFNIWVWGNCFNIFNDRFLYKDDEYSSKELLKIYKKEKRL